MDVHSNKLTCLLIWSVCCLSYWAMEEAMVVRGDAMTPETCNTQTSTPCQAMVGYVPIANIDLSLIASLFSLNNYTSLLGPNQIDPSLPNLSSTLVVPSGHPYLIPQTCGCVSGVRTVTSTNYTVQPGDDLSMIASQFYSSLVSYQEIAAANPNVIQNPSLIQPGWHFLIPIPCACFKQSDGTRPALFLSYQIQNGDSLSGIAKAYNTSAADLQELNSLKDASLTAANVLFIPLPVCTANFSSGVVDANLRVVEGTYELTANDCVQCNCNNGTLNCIPTPSSLGKNCSNLTCPNSSLRLGASTASQGSQGCSVQSCVYMGYNTQSGIVSRLETEQDPKCPAALPPENFYKPPTGLVASPLSSTPATPSNVSPQSPLTPAAIPPASSTNSSSTNSNSATTLLVGVGFSWWWSLLAASLLL